MNLMWLLIMSMILAFSLLQSSSATPPAISLTANCLLQSIRKPVRTTPTLPLSGDATELPTTDLTLQYVAIGRGTQNYTCATSNSHPVQLGAVATLFDATLLAYNDESALNSIPPIAVYIPPTPSSLILPPPFGDLVVLGHHFFDEAGTPTFNLSSVDKILYGMKTADIKAPAGANKGPAGTGAVDWLQLTSKAGYKSVGCSLVYRVVTAGGAAPINCTVEGVLTVPYAAEYWFYD